MEKKRILVADDEARIREMIREYASLEDYRIDEAADGAEALARFTSDKYDLILLDVMMPQMDGWSVCRAIRRTSDVPVIMLTARGQEYDRLFGFELGVDDYVVKPFSPRELMARIKAILRRGHPAFAAVDSHLRNEGLDIDLEARRVEVDGIVRDLTPREFDLLVYLSRNPGRAFTRAQLLNAVWGRDYAGDDRTVDTHVKMLREVLGPYRHLIATVWGVGYRMESGSVT